MTKTDAEWAEIVAKGRQTGRMANTLAKALGRRYAYRWRFVDFRGPNGEESAGVVDVVAIRKSSKKPAANEGLKSLDLFDIILIQVKGGSAREPLSGDIQRLKGVQARYAAQEIVRFRWAKKTDKKKGVAQFSKLDDRSGWEETTAAKLFGKPNTPGKKGVAKSASQPKPSALHGRIVTGDPATKAWATRRANSAAITALPKKTKSNS